MRQARRFQERIVRVIVFVTLTSLCSCRGYPLDRLLDFSDVLDLKYGTATGLGVKVEATDYLGAGLGVANGSADEWYGRYRSGARSNSLLGFGVFSLDGNVVEPDDTTTYTVLGFQGRKTRPPPVSQARIGAELWLFAVSGGIYVNLGEVLDFGLGWFGIDTAGDDGVDKGDLLDGRDDANHSSEAAAEHR